ncbi:putative membrane protein [Tenacibaculum sp. 190524A02b]|uniref:Membrane protein n=1 Tax=Tenacibaculum vairaonense TaxID=3137860 RepID=A0ABP1FEY1_9FLAO
MIFIINILIVFVSIIHLYTFYLQSFVWKTKGKKVFKKHPESYFEISEKLAFNQGIYNAFLAVGLLWTFFISSNQWAYNIALFFLSFIAVAGVIGSITSGEKSIFFIQSLPAFIAIILIIMKMIVF